MYFRKRFITLRSFKSSYSINRMISKFIIVIQLKIRKNIFFSLTYTFTIRVTHIHIYRIRICSSIITIQFISIFMVIHFTISKIITYHTLSFQAFHKLIFRSRLHLDNTPYITQTTRLVIVQNGKVRSII